MTYQGLIERHEDNEISGQKERAEDLCAWDVKGKASV